MLLRNPSACPGHPVASVPGTGSSPAV
jgi:hypothetical protein